MQQRPDADAEAHESATDLEPEALSSNQQFRAKKESRIEEPAAMPNWMEAWSGGSSWWWMDGWLVYLLVKSRPRQKLPTQSRTAHRLETPPSPPPPPPPPRLQLMAAAAACSEAANPSCCCCCLLLSGLSSSPPGSESDSWSWTRRGRRASSFLAGWLVGLSVSPAAAAHLTSPHLTFLSHSIFPCGCGVGVGSRDATRDARAEAAERQRSRATVGRSG
jgi:hypothetical protein